MNRLLISAAHKSSGKTTVTLGLCAALRARGLTVQPFKKGPDYIDPMWLSRASGRDCHNLDFWLMSRDEILRTVAARAADADISIIEGNKGLYDGLDLDGRNSNAALARLLNVPVVLVIDARGMTRGIAPLILGYQAFDREVQIKGVILNQLGGSRHESKLRAVIEHYTDVPVLGAVQHDERLAIVERHLGLIPSNETSQPDARIDIIARTIREGVDLDRMMALAASAPSLPSSSFPSPASGGGLGWGQGAPPSPSLPPQAREYGPHPHSLSRKREREASRGATRDFVYSEPNARRSDLIRLGVARDAAFNFYYPGDLEALRAAGAELVYFDTLRDARLPPVDGLFIGGGFPETHMAALEANASLRCDLHAAIENDLPVYAECGGLMYLSRSIHWRGQTHAMVGAIAADTVMHAKPQGRGYVALRATGAQPWSRGERLQQELRAHEFHYSTLENVAPNTVYAYEVARGYGIDGRHDGIVHRNLLACFTHQRHTDANPWTTRFVEFIRAHRRRTPERRAAR